MSDETDKTSFTPRPWKITGTNGKDIFVEANEEEWERLFCTVTCDDCCTKTAKANAALIVAAPDLFNALEAEDKLSEHESSCSACDTRERGNGYCSVYLALYQELNPVGLRKAALKKARVGDI